MSQQTPKSVLFRREREGTWFELESIVDKIESQGIGAASAEELSRLPHLYRATLSSLSVARTISLDRNLLAYLEALSSRAYFCVYTTRRRPWQVFLEFFTHQFPLAIYAMRWHLLVATAILMLGVLAAMGMVLDEPEMFHAFVSRDYASGRGPDSTTEELRAVLFDGAQFSGSELGNFASFLMTHNARIGLLCFMLGIVFGVPVIYLLFQNGAVLGAFSALYVSRDLGVELYSWLLPHGITEILAVLVCGAAGLYIAESVVFPGEHSRLGNLARRGRIAGAVALGAVLMFVIAGLIEGIFRQTVQSISVRYAVATGTAIFWMLYLGVWGSLVGRNHREELP
jgi:uncharacterized membrane protein SpoIIM required for sporulation